MKWIGIYWTVKRQEMAFDDLYGAVDPEIIEAARRRVEELMIGDINREIDRLIYGYYPEGRDISDLVDVDEPEQKKLNP